MNLQASDILTLESSRIIRASHGEFRTPDSRKKNKNVWLNVRRAKAEQIKHTFFRAEKVSLCVNQSTIRRNLQRMFEKRKIIIPQEISPLSPDGTLRSLKYFDIKNHIVSD